MFPVNLTIKLGEPIKTPSSNSQSVSQYFCSLQVSNCATKLTCYFCFSASQVGPDKLEHDSTQYSPGILGGQRGRGDMNIDFSQAEIVVFLG